MMKTRHNHALPALLLCSAIGYGNPAHAALTDLADAPMYTASNTSIKPNIMFILDDSGSMGNAYLPDSVKDNEDRRCYKNHLYNTVYYNPGHTYDPPVDDTSTPYPNASFTAAPTNGFSTTPTTKNLNSQFRAGGDSSDTQAYYYTYSGGGTPTTGTCYADNKYTKVSVSPASAEAQNFANWYSYYRTRMLTMKTAVGRAFSGIGANYRVGFSTINYTGTDTDNAEFLNISDFDATQKELWYRRIYAVATGDATPLRAALAKAGRIFAGKLGTDPVQYSCQQNFALLTTDGYWNESGTPKRIDGTTDIGNQDGVLSSSPRPLYDGTGVTNYGSSNSLADVAMYYYKTDLRTSPNCTGAQGAGVDVCENNVPGAAPDDADHQHMTTFSLGLGVSGTLTYRADYLSADTGAYHDIVQGTRNWPKPTNNNPTGVDDLWHAAVNGRGVYFSARDPDSLVSGLSDALAGMTARDGSQSTASPSNLEPEAGDNFVYVANYRSTKWDGNLKSGTIDPSTGNLVTTADDWEAQGLLDAKVSTSTDSRTIYTFAAANTNKLKAFTWASLSATEQAYFNDMCSPSAKLSQCSLLSATEKVSASGENLVNFIRGQRGFESTLYRTRDHVLGDIVSSNPVYIKKPPFEYLDTNYATFRDTTQQNRAATVYVGSNDGMLHAFDATRGQSTSGKEKWAYIPPILMGNLHKLADRSYLSNHKYFVDGAPTVAEICPNAPASSCTGAQWKTILVGGLNAGGRGFYALDITDPSSPKGLWNFTVDNDADLGYSFGNPVVTKRKDGTWVVVVTSGYNNVSPGDGEGYLYVLNANTGTLLEKIGTNAGDTTTPSGLGKINAWVRDTKDNTALRFYGGDLLGNVWRFDIDDNVPPTGKEALLLAVLGQVNGAGNQPITTKPELSEGSGGIALIHIGTGRYLGLTDLTNTSQQSFYTIRDKLTNTGLGQVRQDGVLVKHTMEETTDASGHLIRKLVSPVYISYGTHDGWYVDFDPANASGTHLSPGERMTTDIQMQGTTLSVATNVPSSNACTAGGYSWNYSFNYQTGLALQSNAAEAVGQRLSDNAMVAGMKLVKLPDGRTILIITDTAGNVTTVEVGTGDAGSGTTHRVSWRELIR